jgi:replication-associated recombination protein RarA
VRTWTCHRQTKLVVKGGCCGAPLSGLAAKLHFLGPTGCGKTTLACVIANVTGTRLKSSTPSQRRADVRKVLKEAEDAACATQGDPTAFGRVPPLSKARATVSSPPSKAG